MKFHETTIFLWFSQTNDHGAAAPASRATRPPHAGVAVWIPRSASSPAPALFGGSHIELSLCTQQHLVTHFLFEGQRGNSWKQLGLVPLNRQ